MQPRKYKLLVATYSYGGNGGTRSEAKDLSDWLRGLDRKLMRDQRIADVIYDDQADTPIPMTRNQTVLRARKHDCDLVLMLDSDMRPDVEINDDPSAKPFWDSSFDFLDAMYETMPVVVGAPYCGGGGDGGEENVYVFRWQNCVTDNPHEVDMQLKAYSRVEAALHAGIQPAGALPTGCILYDARIFSLIDPTPRYNELRNMGLTSAEAARAAPKWFDYEWCSEHGASKGSTEDVYNTRDLSLAGIHAYGRNPVFCNWDAWAGHWKPKLVRKPQILTADSVSRSLVEVVRRGNESGVRIEHVDFRSPADGVRGPLERTPEEIRRDMEFVKRVSNAAGVLQDDRALTKASDTSPASDSADVVSPKESWLDWQRKRACKPTCEATAS